MIIESGIGNGKMAAVDGDNRLLTTSFNVPFQHLIAKDYQKTFQVWGESNLSVGSVVPLHIKNTSQDKVHVITYIRWQIIDEAGGTALPSAANYIEFGYGAEYASGGTLKTPVNMTSSSSVLSGLTAYQGNPTLSGTPTAFDRHYPKSEGDMYSYNKEGAALLLPSATFTAQYTGDHTSGKVYCRISFAEVGLEGYSG